MLLIYCYDDYDYCDCLAEIILSVYRKASCFSCYATGFSAEIYELCIMIISSSSIFIHGYMNIWYVHVNVKLDSMWISEIRSLHLEAVIVFLLVKAVKTMRSLQCRGTWMPLRVITMWWWSWVELTPRSGYPRAFKIKES